MIDTSLFLMDTSKCGCFILCCISLLSVLVLALSLTACDQRPLDVAPETSFGTWQRLTVTDLPTYDDLSGSSPSNIYGTAEGRLIHYDGSSWYEMDGPEPAYLPDLWMASPDDLYVITASKVFLYDGTRWEMLYEHDTPSLHSIWGSSTSDIYIAALQAIVHFDGFSWSVDSLAADSYVYEIWGSGSSDVFAVGIDELILYNDGTGWAEMHRDAGEGLYDKIWGSGPNDVYVASSRTLMHWDGAGWSPIGLPLEMYHLSALWGTAGDDVYLFYGSGRILHYDGLQWQAMNRTTSMSLYSAWGTSSDHVYAVGESAKIVHYDGKEWSSVSGGAPHYITFVWGLDPGNVYLGNAMSIFRYDGNALEELPNVIDGLGALDLWGTSPSNLVSVGYDGKIFHYDGIQWNRANVPTDRDLRAVSGVARNAIWAVGEDMTCLYYNGSDWVTLYEAIGTQKWFSDVCAAFRNSVFVAGSDGLLAHFNGISWTFFNSGVKGNLNGIWGTSPCNVYAVGNGGVILHFDGKRWEQMPRPRSPREPAFRAVMGTSPVDVFAASPDYMTHFDGSVWSHYPLPPEDYFFLSDIWASTTGELFAVEGYYGGLYVYRR